MWACMQCMRAGTAVSACLRLVASAAGKQDIVALHRRGSHAGNTHKHGDNGKQSVYAVQLSASPLKYSLKLCCKIIRHPFKNSYHTSVFIRTLLTILQQHCKLWSPLNSFKDACRSCQSGMWLQHTCHMHCKLWSPTDTANYGRPLILLKTHVVLVRVACGSRFNTCAL